MAETGDVSNIVLDQPNIPDDDAGTGPTASPEADIPPSVPIPVSPPGIADIERLRVQAVLDADSVDNSLYHIKWIKHNGNSCPIVTQNENGPCPLIAIMNVLLLKCLITLAGDIEYTTTTELMKYLGDYLLKRVPESFNTEEEQENYQQNVSDAFSVIARLQTGIDVNIGFKSPDSFELTPEIVLFDLLGVSIYHGWVIDPQNEPLYSVAGGLFYNRAVELAIDASSSSDEENLPKGLVVSQFLEESSNQLTYQGLFDLNADLIDGQIVVFFRNNHFSTVIKHDSLLYQLVTDQGFLKTESVVWETLSSIDGNSSFVNSFFQVSSVCHSVSSPESEETTGTAEEDDHALALRLEAEETVSDEAFARQLQLEEDRLASQRQTPPARQRTEQQSEGSRSTTSSKCAIQ